MSKASTWWQQASCGYIHEYGVCDNDHPWVDTEIKDSVASVGDAPVKLVNSVRGKQSAGSVIDIIGILRKHRLVTYLSAGMVSCECGYICALSWYTEHVISMVFKE